MKPIIIILFLIIYSVVPVRAQTYLQVGDTAPSISGLRWLQGGPIEKFQRGKTYALVFAASWCSPCLSSIREISEFAEAHRAETETLTFFIHEQIGQGKGPYGDHLVRFLRGYDEKLECPVAIDDQKGTLQQAWQIDDTQQNALPIFIVVDRDGKIGWIGTAIAQLEQAVKHINSSAYSLSREIEKARSAAKNDAPFDFKKLYLVDGNGGADDAFAFRSVIARYEGKIGAPNPEFIQEVTGIYATPYVQAGRVQLIGAPLSMLYYTAYSDSLNNNPPSRNPVTNLFRDTIAAPHHRTSYGRWWHKPVLDVADSSLFQFDWKSPVNRYNYSLQVPAVLGTAAFMQALMQRDLLGYFGYDVTVETRMMPYWKLSAPDKAKAKKLLASRHQGKTFEVIAEDGAYHFKNAIVRDIIWMCGSNFGYRSHDYGRMPVGQQGAFMDETGLDLEIDFRYQDKCTFEEFRSYLASKGLLLTRAQKPMKVVVIRDPKN
ncbi:MAG TPA: redoxin family protein [Ohtaekwangia sp.]